MPPIILLKLDDVTANGAPPGRPIVPAWERIVDYLAQRQIKSSLGVICFTLEEDHPLLFDWIRRVRDTGLVEFWLHGYRDRQATDPHGEFEIGTWEEQKAVLETCQRLARAKLGFEFAAFGPHWTGTTEATDRALEAVPSIRIWLHGPARPLHFRRVSIPRIFGLEDPVFVPDATKFKAAYVRVAPTRDVLAIGGHPASWSDERWDGFVQIIDFLVAQGSVFMTPSEYLRHVAGPTASARTSAKPS